jgi:hypothetical protein
MVLEQRCKARKPGLCGEGAGAERERERETEHPIWPAFTIQPWIWFPPKIPLNHGGLSHGINYAPHSHPHYHCKAYIQSWITLCSTVAHLLGVQGLNIRLHPLSVLFTLKVAITMQAETLEQQYTPDTLTLKSKITRWIQAIEKL